MPVDATEQILNEAVSAREDAPVIYPQEQLNWNIDDVDRRSYMVDRRMSGCFWLGSRKAIDPEHPGKIYVDGKEVGTPLFHEGFMADRLSHCFCVPGCGSTTGPIPSPIRTQSPSAVKPSRPVPSSSGLSRNDPRSGLPGT